MNGFVKGSSQSSLNNKIKQVQNAYRLPAQSSGLYHDNGSATPHLLTADGTFRGIETSFQWTNSNNAEYATGRSFAATMTVRKVLQGVDDIVQFSETVTVRGTGGPRRHTGVLQQGNPRRQIIAQKTPIFITQAGNAIGRFSAPAPPAPLYPSDEDYEQRTNSATSPNRDSGIFQDYGVNWSYSFTLLGGDPKPQPNQR